MSRNDNEIKNGSIASAGSGDDTQNPSHKRICHIVKRPDFDGYGFNLHSEKGKPGQFIGKVDENSPAEEAGLKQGDRIIEVNGLNIGNETHKQVVQRIKAIADEVRLLVIDPALEKPQKTPTSGTPTTPTSNKNNNNNNVDVTTTSKITTSTITVQSTKVGGAKLTPVSTPVAPPKIEDIKPTVANTNDNSVSGPASATASVYAATLTKPSSPTFTSTMTINSNSNSNNNNLNNNNHHKDATSIGSANSDVTDATIEAASTPAATNGNHHKKNGNTVELPNQIATTTTSIDNSHNHQMNQQNKNNGTADTIAIQTPASPLSPLTLTTPASQATPKPPSSTGLNLPMTAAEMRAKLLAKKKYDPKNDNVDLRKKFEIIQKL